MIVTALLFSSFFVRCGALVDNGIDIRYTLNKLQSEIRTEMRDMINQEVASLRQELHELRLRIPVQSTQASNEKNSSRNLKEENMNCATSIVGNDYFFDGCNVHIRNGRGMTATANGLGNVILGYNEVDDDNGNRRHVRTGSHTLVIGPSHSYSHYGGLVMGHSNTLTAKYASVLGGNNNVATGEFSSVLGGNKNIADGEYSLVLGGSGNSAKSYMASVAGGEKNKAKGRFSFVSGGYKLISIGKYG